MTDTTRFEERFGRRLDAELKGRVGPVDAAMIAATAIAPRTPGDHLRNRLGLGPLPLGSVTRSLAIIATVALLVLIAVALAAGVAGRGDPAIAFVRTNGELVLSARDGSGQRVIGDLPAPERFTQLEWAPRGEHLAVIDEGLQLIVFRTTGEVVSQRTLDLGTSRIEWSPDGQRLAVFDGPSRGAVDACGPLVHPRLEVLDPDGGLVWTARVPEAFRYPEGLGELAWSPDGRQLAIVGSIDPCTPEDNATSSIWLVDLGGEGFRQLSVAEGQRGDFQPAWLPDGSLLFSRSDVGLVEIEPSTGQTSVMLDLARACEGCRGGPVRIEDVSPDGTRLAIKHATLGPIVLDLGTGAVTVVKPERKGAVALSPILWAPDGTSLLVDDRPASGGAPAVVQLDPTTGQMQDLLADTEFFAVLD